MKNRRIIFIGTQSLEGFEAVDIDEVRELLAACENPAFLRVSGLKSKAAQAFFDGERAVDGQAPQSPRAPSSIG